MRDGARISVFFVLLCGAPWAATCADAPSFQGLGDLPGGEIYSWGANVSADGRTAVGLSESGSGYEGYRWTAETGMVGMGDLPGGDFYRNANDVSFDGSVIVGYSRSAQGYEAYRWTAETDMVGLGFGDPGDTVSSAEAVSFDGSVIAGRAQTQAFRWTADTGIVTLGSLAGPDDESWAHGVSGDGLVIVGSSDVPWGISEAFRWTEDEGMVGLGYLPGGDIFGQATAASVDGSVIVGISDIGSGNAPFRWTADGGMQPLWGSGWARDVNSDGSVVVGDRYGEAVIWDKVNGARQLPTLLTDEYGLDLTGWTLVTAKSVSADGNTFGGLGINPAGYYEGWIATIPEPASAVLLAFLGLASIRGRRVGASS